MNRHESKGNMMPTEDTIIVEAYGLRKCPKLVEQVCMNPFRGRMRQLTDSERHILHAFPIVYISPYFYSSIAFFFIVHSLGKNMYVSFHRQVADDNVDVRKNALSVLCDEFKDPNVIHGCVEAGIVKVLATMISDPDHITRKRASQALSIAAEDAKGLESILVADVIKEILQGMNDNSDDVRENVYECLCHVTRTTLGVEACVAAGVTVEFVTAVMAEKDHLKPIILRTIHNTCKIASGLEDALKASAVPTLIGLLRGATSTSVVLNTARTLGFIFFSDVAKAQAIEEKGIEVLIGAMKKAPSEDVKKELTFALMVVTSTDEGKKQVAECDGVACLVAALASDTSDRLVKLNVLKVVSNVAVFPAARTDLKRSTVDDDTATPHVSCIPLIEKLQAEAEASGDRLIAKHAKTALAAVLWTP